MNIYESMNRSFEAAMEKKAPKKLKESVEKPVKEFKELAIPAPFADYYKIIRPEEYEDILGFEYNEAEMKREAAEQHGVEDYQYAILKDGFDTDGECKILAVCKDGDVSYVAINVDGRMFPIDFAEIEGEIREVEKPVEECVKEPIEEAVEEEEKPLEEALNPWDKLVAAYPDLAEEPIRESAEGEEVVEEKAEEVPEEARKEEEEEDLWDKIYGELTMDGETVPSSTGKSYKFNTGAGYNPYRVWTLMDECGLKIGADSIEELKAAADIARKYADKGVTYELSRGRKHIDRTPFIIKIHIPEELCESIEDGIDVKRCRRILRRKVDWDEVDSEVLNADGLPSDAVKQLRGLYRDGEIDSDELDYIKTHWEELL